MNFSSWLRKPSESLKDVPFRYQLKRDLDVKKDPILGRLRKEKFKSSGRAPLGHDVLRLTPSTQAAFHSSPDNFLEIKPLKSERKIEFQKRKETSSHSIGSSFFKVDFPSLATFHHPNLKKPGFL